MRKDLNKLLCERERNSGGTRFHDLRNMKEFTNTRGEEYENMPTREGMKSRYKVRGDWKTFGENLNPLYGFVRKSVGKPWDKSFSELCEVFDMSSVINQHILQHLWDIVETKTFMEDNVVMHRTGYYSHRGAAPVKDENGPLYYVHPTTGILLKNQHHKYYTQQQRERKATAELEEKNNPLRRIISDKVELRRRNEDDTWFYCELSEVPKSEVYRRRLECYTDGKPVFEEILRTNVYRFDLWEKRNVNSSGTYKWSMIKTQSSRDYRPYTRGTYVSKVRTLSKKELKQYGLV